MLKRWAALPPRIRWLAVGAAVVLAVAFLWALFVPAADWLAHQDAGSARGPLHETAVDNARGRLLTLGAGLVAAAALVFTALNFRLLRRNSEQADQWQRRTHELTEQGQVTDRYTRAIEQLGSDKLDVRIGGIYALERIARDSARDHPAVMEVLAAFIREHSREPWPPPGRPGSREQERSTRPDVQAAATVVGRRNAKRDSEPPDLGGADLIWAHLVRANLSGAHLSGVNLTDADLSGANLSGVNLSGTHIDRASFYSADLRDASLDATSLILTWFARADLRGAGLRGADLTDASLSGAHLDGADLTDAILIGAHLDGAILIGAILDGAILIGATLDGADLDGADLTRTRWPDNAPVPEGWELDADGLLRRAGTDPGPEEGDWPAAGAGQ